MLGSLNPDCKMPFGTAENEKQDVIYVTNFNINQQILQNDSLFQTSQFLACQFLCKVYVCVCKE